MNSHQRFFSGTERNHANSELYEGLIQAIIARKQKSLELEFNGLVFLLHINVETILKMELFCEAPF